MKVRTQSALSSLFALAFGGCGGCKSLLGVAESRRKALLGVALRRVVIVRIHK